MTIGIITPYYKEPLKYLKKCYESVLDQKLDTKHYFIADGHPNNELDKWNIEHVILPVANSDNGNTPRGLGGALAISNDCDFIAYLDSDNWFYPNHLKSLIDLHNNTGARVCTSFRTIYDLDGNELIGVYDQDEKNLKHVDTSCYLLHRDAFSLNEIWLKMPKILSPICDRVFLAGVIRKKYKAISTRTKTVAFRSQYVSHYLQANLTPPLNAKTNAFGKESYNYLKTFEGMGETVDRIGFFPL